MNTAAAITKEECMAKLAAIAGAEHTSGSDETITVVAGNASQVAEILRLANNNGIAVAACGSRTKQGWGNPVEAGIRLDLTRMNSVREHAWQDLTCTVEAGCTWSAMQAELARYGQIVALDPLWPEQATVGGIVAVNDGGCLRLRYGGLRDLIIGMTVVLADGTIAKTGGKVVKNVAGYDLHKLMTGSYGTLGVITEVNFRLHPVEANALTWTAVAAQPLEFEMPLHRLLDSQLTPSSVQLRLDADECALDVRLAAPVECIGDHAARLTTIFGAMALKPADAAVWQARQQLHDTADAFVLKLSTLPSDLCVLASELQTWAAKHDSEIAIAAQATGLTTVALKAAANEAADLVTHLRSRLKDKGGSAVVLQAPQKLSCAIDRWGCESNALPLMKEIKRRFDPNRVLNPGRFVGNI